MLNRFALSMRVFKSRLARKVSLWVFASVVAIEFVILVPSYYRRREELLHEQVVKVEQAFLPLVKRYRQQPDIAFAQVRDQLVIYPEVVGIRFDRAQTQTTQHLGETLKPQPAQVQATGTTRAVGRNRYEVFWRIPRPDGDFQLGLRLNTQPVQAKLNAYTLRILGLIVLISGVVTATTMYTVSVLVITPILRLRDDLLRTGDMVNVESDDFHFDVHQRQRQDEMGELFRAFERMFGRIQHEIRDRHQAEASLASETLLTQQAQQHSQAVQQVLEELRTTQVQLIHSEKMSSLGQLVAGIAHEFNNPVTFINGNLVPLQEYTDGLLQLLAQYQLTYPDTPVDLQDLADSIDVTYIQADLPKILASMKMGVQRIRTIVGSLRNFSRLDESAMKQVDVHEGLESALMLIQHRLNEKPLAIQLVKDYGKLPLVECFANQLNQVFMSLFSNAIDAINAQEQAGCIQISTRQLSAERLEIAIQDNGVGIPDTDLPHVFDPFFTTKPVGKGVGLGLSVSYQIIQMHGGQLNCASTEADGTRFTIEIPICQNLLGADMLPRKSA
ncbi:hypothetical protein IQ266_05830 [filamentous cyanobacterium LEGE 11480]|uniref:histidine kinase n=1 Tax=Romeriopsis navalis LEGE 11480 TaxID=2777977 RepID=A0A928VJ45_9CYAN|nr:ATP-binding protein [Romeriopsis navalis]MBE9029280.1 hypothetical protein [Romeriopsis navalis LEGE 11480]